MCRFYVSRETTRPKNPLPRVASRCGRGGIGPSCRARGVRLDTLSQKQRGNMMDIVDRRSILASGALALAGAATQSVSAQAQAAPKPLFPIPAITIPIMGENEVFPV